MKKSTKSTWIALIISFIVIFIIFTPIPLSIKFTLLACSILGNIIWLLINFIRWVEEGFRLALKGDELQLEGFKALSADIMWLYKYVYSHTNPSETVEEKTKILEEIKKLGDKVIEVEKTSQDNVNKVTTKVETMGFHFKFLMGFIPMALAIIAILIAIGKIQLRIP